MNAEKKLRMRIRRILSLAGFDQNQSSLQLTEIEDQVVALFRAYSKADDTMKSSVYAEGEREVFKTIKKAAMESRASDSLV